MRIFAVANLLRGEERPAVAPKPAETPARLAGALLALAPGGAGVGGEVVYQAVAPPSTTMVWPVM